MSRRAGDFSGHVITSPYDFRIADFDQDRQIYGLGQRVIWPFAAVQDAAGNLYVMERKFVHQMTGGLWLMHNRDGAFNLVPGAVYSARGEVKRQFSPDRHVYRDQLMAKLGDLSPAEEQSFDFGVGDDDIHWHEGSLCELDGPAMGPGLQAFFLDETFPWLLFSRAFWVTGTVLGEPVSGIAAYEHSYWRPRAEWKETPYFTHQQVAWSYFCNRYSDGAIEWGHVICNRGGSGAVLVADDKQAVQTTSEFTSRFDLDDNGLVSGATYRTGDGEWVFTADPRGSMTHFNAARGGAYQARAGNLRRAGDTRTPTLSFCWIEAFGQRIVDENLAALS